MEIFNLYSEYYNLLYKDKNYAEEAEFVSGKINKYKPESKIMLDLGCGTGKHDFCFAQKGYDVTGIDFSEHMLLKAENERLRLNIPNLKFIKADIRNYFSDKKFDVIVSLFHVFSYQNSDDDINSFFNTVSKHLNPGGLLIFDFWYGPAVLSERPSLRVKRLEGEFNRIVRIAEPEIDYSNNLVHVNYDIFITDKRTIEITEIKETHSMRYFFMPEIKKYLENIDYSLLEAQEWLSNETLCSKSWNAFIVCRKEDKRGK